MHWIFGALPDLEGYDAGLTERCRIWLYLALFARIWPLFGILMLD
jgi:hypothetical protein